MGAGRNPHDGRPQPAPALSEAAGRALAEAEERRRQQAASPPCKAPKEVGGREGPDPTRYGDWENKGVASDF